MKTKIIISLSLIVATALMMSCTDQPYFDIPYDENGDVLITEISVVTADEVTTADESFTINCYFPNANPGSTMVATVLKRQVPSWDPNGAEQLLPLASTEKSITVGNDHKTSVSYTRQEAQLVNVGDAVTVVFSGETDSGIIEIVLANANEE
uniref:hypothetical protein n=1 Tax=uncultured Draconibacterium sp. TaxID=1573823 RepID=UPI003217E224